MQKPGVASRDTINEALSQLNLCSGIRHAFAYGSGVFSQAGAPADSRRMIDLIVVVDDPRQWHRENMLRNSGHYTFLPRAVGADATVAVAEGVGSGIHFNAYVRTDVGMVKYGVASTQTVLEDLRTWSTLYLGGRLHKPVRHLVQDPEVMAANRENLRSALATALLLLPDTFSTRQLHETIVGLSYTGDIRMAIAEDRRKVKLLRHHPRCFCE
mmetsp:Transcript_39872/g.76198  ORF Transcript_39872/g.76198 Transcript_39872/m.76198 type:complete len:213 (-) Transcript_39872:3755-4393(-)